MSQRFLVEGGEVVLVSTVQGLVSERDRVVEVLAKEDPAAVAFGLSPESVAELLRYRPEPDFDPFEELPDHDYIYSVKLAEYGDIDLPAPDLMGALAWARENERRFFGVDLTEEAYEDLFTRTVSTFGLLRYGRIQRNLAKRPPKAPDARAFAIAWDSRIRKVRGLRLVEAARERHMASQVARVVAEVAGRVVLIVDAPREAGTAAAIRAVA